MPITKPPHMRATTTSPTARTATSEVRATRASHLYRKALSHQIVNVSCVFARSPTNNDSYQDHTNQKREKKYIKCVSCRTTFLMRDERCGNARGLFHVLVLINARKVHSKLINVRSGETHQVLGDPHPATRFRQACPRTNELLHTSEL